MTQKADGPACSLEGGAFQERVALIAALNQKFLRRVNRQGAVLELAYDAAAHREVEELVERERVCCSFLKFEIKVGENTVLTITVPPHAIAKADEALAPFQDPQAALDAVAGCGACEMPVAPLKAKGAAGAAATSSAVAVLACGACCVIPLAFPAVAATAAGGLLAWLAGSQLWLTGLAVLMVVMAWAWIWHQSVKRRARASTATLATMGAASLAVLLAVAWPQLEPSLMAVLK